MARVSVSRRQVRDLQRMAHLVAGVLLLAFVYLAPAVDGIVWLVRWVVVPVGVLSGIALWKWPRIRSWLARRGARR
ncbi:MAG TPA: hypothetical protein VFG33_03280 [Kribbella sp.]|uniref:hypothetical protein n=1 Tax=Kribbella sp. TaxID=1871183 RepID=UPI002D78CCCC|nr:hypothetical protein [Kribbella sp.]HET6292363.1 hypothetical protein [Kribbella sp.]